MMQTNPIALCVTCIVDQAMPEIGVATVKLLRRAGFEVDFPQAQTCCGQPFFNSGFKDEAAKLAMRLIEIFEPYEVVVLPSGSCTTMIRVEYSHLLEDKPKWYYRAKRLAEKTFELSEFLAKQAKFPLVPPSSLEGTQENSGEPGGTQGSLGPTVTYHDSCHMCRMLGLKDEPREMLTAVGCTITEMESSNRCCGFGGLFSMRMSELSNAMTSEKVEKGRATNADVLVTADPGCLMQMRGLAGEGQRVEHIATVLEEMTR
ncbi:MAG: (Fe-S)-binding protein [Ardenticatenaceae bacterium]|nr:(Fe-S)-binding protein [Ardenticatenaceae bacterium]